MRVLLFCDQNHVLIEEHFYYSRGVILRDVNRRKYRGYGTDKVPATSEALKGKEPSHKGSRLLRV